uniref:Uncharacterized protein n=1 Tax=Fagus sylvatica TaxID=28930 RepID=A0A2N9I6V3_FAGSY
MKSKNPDVFPSKKELLEAEMSNSEEARKCISLFMKPKQVLIHRRLQVSILLSISLSICCVDDLLV